MKPGNRHESEMVPSHAKLALWKMREWIYVDLLTMALSVFAQKGSFLILDVKPPAPETPRKSGGAIEALFASVDANDFGVCF